MSCPKKMYRMRIVSPKNKKGDVDRLPKYTPNYR